MEVMQHKNIAVLGMGRSGIAAARFALNEGARVTAFDQRPLQELDAGVQALIAEGVVFHAAAFALSAFDAIDMVIVSPGVDWNHAVLVALRERGTTVTSEMALALPFVRGKICAITGTNGKSTTTDLLGKILSAGGQRVVVGGNIGIPLLELREQLSDAQWVVLEVSSFQIESTRVLRPDMTIFLNISPDHLDRYGTVAAYIAAKAQLTARLTSDSRLVFNAEDPVVVRLAEGSSAQPFPFVCGRYHHPQLPQETIDGVTTAAELLGVDCAIITQTVAAYQGLPHRCQLVSEWRGIRFVNDSKGTNVGAAVTALKSMSGPVLLIAGGREKATSLDPLREALRERVKRVFLMGEARERMQAAFDQTVPVELVMNMDGAVAAAVEHAEAGDTVLLSPACASFDMYADYAARGEDFVRCVQAATCGGAH